MARILIVDDELGIRELLSDVLADEGHKILTAHNAETATKRLDEHDIDLVLLDIWMPDQDGVSLLKLWAKKDKLTMPVIMMSGHGTIETAVEATRIGAADYLEKPIALQKLITTVSNVLQKRKRGITAPLTLASLSRVSGIGAFWQRVKQFLDRQKVLLVNHTSPTFASIIARTDIPPQKQWLDITTLSQSITRDMFANHRIHTVFCGELAEASRQRRTNIEFCLMLAQQLDIRVIAATEHPREVLLEQNWSSKTIDMFEKNMLQGPKISEVINDVPHIVTIMLEQLIAEGDVPMRRFSTGALNAMRMHHWDNPKRYWWDALLEATQNLALIALDTEISENDVRQILHADNPGTGLSQDLVELFDRPLREARDIFERRYLEYMLGKEKGSITRTAERAGIERTHLHRKLKQLGIHNSNSNQQAAKS